MKTCYLVVGCPGSGKSWVCDQVKHLFTYVHHDLYIGMAGDNYVDAIKDASEDAEKPLLIEAPFSISKIKEPLEAEGFEVIPVYLQDDHDTISKRYEAREKKQIPKGHLTRQNTYLGRAKAFGHFHGKTEEVLEHLKDVARRFK